jgi:hypothetical protein
MSGKQNLASAIGEETPFSCLACCFGAFQYAFCAASAVRTESQVIAGAIRRPKKTRLLKYNHEESIKAQVNYHLNS